MKNHVYLKQNKSKRFKKCVSMTKKDINEYLDIKSIKFPTLRNIFTNSNGIPIKQTKKTICDKIISKI